MKLRRILVVSFAFPSTIETAVYGIHQRLRIFLEAAASVASELQILFFVEPDYLPRFEASRFAAELKAHWGIDAQVRLAPRGTRVRSWMTANIGPIWSVKHHYLLYKACGADQRQAVESALADHIDLVIAFELQSALAILDVNPHVNLPPMALDLNDIAHVSIRRMIARPPRKPLEVLYLPALFLGERRAIARSEVAFVCSETARRYLTRVTHGAPIKVAPNAVAYSLTAAQRPNEVPRTLLFVGMFAYPPNFEAAEWLLQQMFPLVLESVPDARLMLVGGEMQKIVHLQHVCPNVDFLGFVPDIGEIYRRSAISCSPIFSGGGTRTKIIEAAAHGVPVVSTTLGAEGLDFEDEREILLRDSPKAFAKACIELLNDPARARDIGKRAHHRARAYDRSVVIPGIATDLVAAAEHGRSRRA